MVHTLDVAELRFDQVNIVVPDVDGAARFLRALGVRVPELSAEFEEWSPHHVGFPAVSEGFDADLDSPAFASHWGGLPSDFTGVVVNLRTMTREEVDETCERAVDLGAEVLKSPYDTFWGVRYAVVRGPGPIVVGLMSPPDPSARGVSPQVRDFA